MEHARIRAMTDEDIPEVAQIERSAFSMPWSADAFQETLHSPHAFFFVAEWQDGIAGYIGAYVAADEAEVMNVAVREEARRRHIAQGLAQAALEESKARGARSIFLEVRVGNEAAIALYQKLGFSTISTRKGFYDKPREDAYVMSAQLWDHATGQVP